MQAVNKRRALELVRMDDTDDPWGTCMAHWFGVAGTLYWRYGEVPADWQYRAGIGSDVLDEWPDNEYAQLFDSGELTVRDLMYAGEVMNRWASRLKRAGRDY